MEQEFFRHVNDLSLDVAGNHRVEGAGRISTLKGTPDKPHRAETTACREQVDFQLLLREVAIPLGENQRHDAHRVICYTNVQMAHLRMSRTPKRNTARGNDDKCGIKQAIHSRLLPSQSFPSAMAPIWLSLIPLPPPLPYLNQKFPQARPSSGLSTFHG